MPSRRLALPFVDVRSRLALVATMILLAAALFAMRAPAPAAAVVPAFTGAVIAPSSLTAPVLPFAARGGGGFRSRPRLSPDRPTSRSRPATRRNPNTGRAMRSFSRTLLRALGIAFLLSFLFGIGPGGSPLGLLLLVGIVALVVVMARRRRRSHVYR